MRVKGLHRSAVVSTTLVVGLAAFVALDPAAAFWGHQKTVSASPAAPSAPPFGEGPGGDMVPFSDYAFPTTTTTTTTTVPPAPKPSSGPKSAPKPAPAPPPPATGDLFTACPGSSIPGEIHALINQDRAANGLGPMSWHGSLRNLACDWSYYMSQTGSFSHRSLAPVFGWPGFGGFSTLGENLYLGGSGASAQQIHAAFMNSAGHRANILKPNFTYVGIALYIANGQLWLVENFGG